MLTAKPPTVIGVTPPHEPDARLAADVSRAGRLGVLDLGRGGEPARAALALARTRVPAAFGVRVPAGCDLHPDEIQDAEGAGPHTVLLGPGSPWRIGHVPAPCVFAEVTAVRQACDAVAEGAAGLVVRGAGRGGSDAFRLLRRVLAEVEGAGDAVPVWVRADTDRSTAAALRAGAVGVVVDARPAPPPAVPPNSPTSSRS